MGDVDILYGNHCLHHTLEVWVGGGGERTKTPLCYSSIGTAEPTSEVF